MGTILINPAGGFCATVPKTCPSSRARVAASTYWVRNKPNDIPFSQSTSKMRTVSLRLASSSTLPANSSRFRAVSARITLPGGANGSRISAISAAETNRSGTTRRA